MAENYDAFTNGVDLGGLRVKSDIRIAVCYILKEINCPISNSGLTGSMQDQNLINFFELNEALSALCENGIVIKEERPDDVYYTLSPEGVDIATKLEADVPVYFRDKAVAIALKVAAREKRKQYAHTDVKKLERGYHAVLSITEGDTVMMRTEIYTPDRLQADAICNAFEENPQKLYAAVINSFTFEE